MKECRHCGQSGRIFSPRLGFCAACIRSHFSQVWPEIEAYHHESRRAFKLPVKPPQDPDGKACTLCFHACRIPEGGIGYCGARRVSGGKLKGGNAAGAGVKGTRVEFTRKSTGATSYTVSSAGGSYSAILARGIYEVRTPGARTARVSLQGNRAVNLIRR